MTRPRIRCSLRIINIQPCPKFRLIQINWLPSRLIVEQWGYVSNVVKSGLILTSVPQLCNSILFRKSGSSCNSIWRILNHQTKLNSAWLFLLLPPWVRKPPKPSSYWDLCQDMMWSSWLTLVVHIPSSVPIWLQTSWFHCCLYSSSCSGS